MGYPTTTQDSLPAVGQTLLDGLLPAGFLRKVSECFLHFIPLSQALLGAICSTAAVKRAFATPVEQTDARNSNINQASANRLLQHGHSPSKPLTCAEKAVGCNIVIFALKANGARCA